MSRRDELADGVAPGKWTYSRHRQRVKGTYIPVDGETTTALALVVNRMYAVPVVFAEPDRPIDRIVINPTSTVTNASVRFAMYDDNGDSFPGNRLYEVAGALAVATTGPKELTWAFTPVSGREYWVAVLCQTAAPVVLQILGTGAIPVGNLADCALAPACYYQTVTAGVTSMPADWGATRNYVANGPRISFRIA